MHTAWVRLNAVVFFGLTVLLGLSVLTALSTYLHKGTLLRGQGGLCADMVGADYGRVVYGEPEAELRWP